NIEAPNVLPSDQLELRGLLQVRIGDLGQLGGDARELGDIAVGDAAAGFRMNDEALVRRQLACRHLPRLRYAVDQHATRLSAGHAQRREITGNRDACGGDLRAFEQLVRIAIDLRVRRRELYLDLRPIGVELLRQNERQGGHDALAHFRRWTEDR